MGKSVFIIPSRKDHVNRLQFRKLKDELGGQSLSLSGMCSDRREAVGQLTEDVRKRMRFGTNRHPVSATIVTLTPRNVPSSEASWLKVPFVWERGSHGHDAGSIACSSTIEFQGRAARPASFEELTLLGLAVLRRLGIECYYSYFHSDPANALFAKLAKTARLTHFPCILVPDMDTALVAFYSPYLIPQQDLEAGVIEVLDDKAMLSIFRINTVSDESVSLLHDIAKMDIDLGHLRATSSISQGLLGSFNPHPLMVERARAIAIGHLLHEGSSSWTIEEAEYSIEAAKTIMNIRERKLRSIRKIVESDVDHIGQMRYHFIRAAVDLLCDNLRDDVMGLAEGMPDDYLGDADLFLGLINASLVNAENHVCLSRFAAYLGLAGMMNAHIHPADGCEERKTVH